MNIQTSLSTGKLMFTRTFCCEGLASRGLLASLLVVATAADLTAGEVRLLNERFTKASGYGAASVSFSPDGRVLASDNGHMKMLRDNQRKSYAPYVKWHVQLWDVESGRIITQSREVPSRPTRASLRFLPDGKTVVTANGMVGGREMRVWSVAGGIRNATYRTPKIVREFGIAGSPLTTSDQIVTHLAISPDGKSLAAAGSYGFADNTTILKIWPTDGSSQRNVRNQFDQFYISDLCWSPGGEAVVMLIPYYEKARTVQGRRVGGHAGNGVVIVVRDAQDLDQLILEQRFPDVPQGSRGVTPIPGTSWIAFPGPHGTILVFDLSKRKEVFHLKGAPGGLNGALAASRDGSLLAAGGSSVVIWDLKTREVFARSRIANHVVYDLEFSPDGRKLAIAGHNLYVWNLPQVEQEGLEGR